MVICREVNGYFRQQNNDAIKTEKGVMREANNASMSSIVSTYRSYFPPSGYTNVKNAWPKKSISRFLGS